MKKIGIVSLVLGIFTLILVLSMDTTVASRGGDRVYNIGLMNAQQNYLIISIALIVVGLLIALITGRKNSPFESLNKNIRSKEEHDIRDCPFCAEAIKAKAIVCRYCGHDLVPLEALDVKDDDYSSNSKAEVAKNKIIENIKSIEISIMENKKIGFLLNYVVNKLTILGGYAKYISIFLIIIGFIFLIYSLLSGYSLEGVIYRVKISLSFIILGSIVYFRKIIRQNNINNFIAGDSEFLKEKNYPKIFGLYVDIVLLQTVIVILIFVVHDSYWNLDLTYFLAVLGLFLGGMIIHSGDKLYGVITSAVSLSYIFYRHFLFSSLEYSSNKLQETILRVRYEWSIDTELYFWLIAISVAVPHLRLIKLGEYKYGSFRGDFELNIKHHKILLPITSAFIVCIFWSVIYGVFERVYDLIVYSI